MRVVSLVPSWTETLIEAGIEVCGRTRFCIHPGEKVKNIPSVGGTKSVDWELIKKIKPDLVLLDKEENPKEFASDCPFPWHATHVLDLQSCQKEMSELANVFSNKKLNLWSEDLGNILMKPARVWDWEKIPAEMAKLTGDRTHSGQVLYLIWKNPWMTVTGDTYIGSVLQFLGAPMVTLGGEKRYPEIGENELKKHYNLFSSEPFPFLKKHQELNRAGFAGSIVDGEKYSWFGLRGLTFLTQDPYKL